MKKEKKKLYICLDAQSKNNNIDFMLLCENDIMQLEEKYETIEDYIDSIYWDVWQEIPITIENISKIEELLKVMKKETRRSK